MHYASLHNQAKIPMTCIYKKCFIVLEIHSKINHSTQYNIIKFGINWQFSYIKKTYLKMGRAVFCDHLYENQAPYCSKLCL